MRYDLYRKGSDGSNIPENNEIEAESMEDAGLEYMRIGAIIDFWPTSGIVIFTNDESGEIIEEGGW